MLAPLDIPDLVRQSAMANGVEGRRWLEELPGLVAAMTDRWGLELGSSFPGGTASFVAGATDRSGRACVLKVAVPIRHEAPESFGRSVLVHQLAAGRGCVGLLDFDESARAMLLERVGPHLDELGMPASAHARDHRRHARELLATRQRGLRPTDGSGQG